MPQDTGTGGSPPASEARSEELRLQMREMEKIVADHLKHFSKASSRGDIEERDYFLQMFCEANRALNKLYDEGIKLILPNFDTSRLR